MHKGIRRKAKKIRVKPRLWKNWMVR